MIYSIKHLVGPNEELLGKWTKVTPEEFDAIQDSLVGENYARGAVGRLSLRLYLQEGYAVVCTHMVGAEQHPTTLPPEPVTVPASDPGFEKRT